MAFTGYVFKNKEHIRPFLENAETGPTVQWAKEQGSPDKYYNSICFVGPDGELIETYSKTFLFMTDENWADEGPGFKSINAPGLGKVGFGICMDINPYKFMAPFDAYEFANFHLHQKTDIILCSMAWLASGEKSSDHYKDTEVPDASNIDYWCERLLPLTSALNPKTATNRNVLFVVCNRTGTENGLSFCGSSSIMLISPQGSIRILGSLGKHQEDIM
ncbi:7976_t:CDS:2, partial [Acaulospora colombiana]